MVNQVLDFPETNAGASNRRSEINAEVRRQNRCLFKALRERIPQEIIDMIYNELWDPAVRVSEVRTA
jgi:hypothetical protein